MTRIVLGVIPTGRDAVVAEVNVEHFKAAELTLEKEARQRQALLADEARTKPTTETPTRRIVGLLGGRASGWF